MDGISHLTALLDRTPSRRLRGRLLQLVEALLAPEAAHADDSAARAARENGVAFMAAGGVQLMADMVAGGA